MITLIYCCGWSYHNILHCRSNSAISISRTKWEIFSWHHYPDRHVRRWSDYEGEQCLYCCRVHVCAWHSNFSWVLERDRVSVYGLNHVLFVCASVCLHVYKKQRQRDKHEKRERKGGKLSLEAGAGQHEAVRQPQWIRMATWLMLNIMYTLRQKSHLNNS